MFQVTVDGKRYRVIFAYAKVDDGRIATGAFIRNEENAVIHFSDAVCSKKDNFSKEKGRKLALARLVKDFPREVRAAFWKAYFEKASDKGRPRPVVSIENE